MPFFYDDDDKEEEDEEEGNNCDGCSVACKDATMGSVLNHTVVGIMKKLTTNHISNTHTSISSITSPNGQYVSATSRRVWSIQLDGIFASPSVIDIDMHSAPGFDSGTDTDYNIANMNTNVKSMQVLLLGTVTHLLHGVSVADGAILWTCSDCQGSIFTSVAPHIYNNKHYPDTVQTLKLESNISSNSSCIMGIVGCNDGYVRAINCIVGCNDGYVRAIKSTSSCIMGIVGCNDGYVRAIDCTTGELLWKTNVHCAIYATPYIVSHPHNTPSMPNNIVIVATTGGDVYILDSYSGSILTSLKLPAEVFSSPIGIGIRSEMEVLCTDTSINTDMNSESKNLHSLNSYRYRCDIYVGCRDDHVYHLKYTVDQ